MLATVLIPVILALGVAAEPSFHPVRRAVTTLSARQAFTADSLPSECTSQCTSTLQIYNACTANDQATCLTVCNSDTFNDFVGCFDCVIDNTPGFPSSSISALQSTIDSLESACAQAGTTPSVTRSLGAAATGVSGTAPSATASDLVTVPGGSASASAPGAASSSGVVASASSAAGAIASGASSAASRASSVAGAGASSAASAAASVTPSGGASRLNAGAWALGALGAAAGVLAL